MNRRVLVAVSLGARLLGALLLTLLVATPALAQTGQINGLITDNTGGVVPGVSVKATEEATGCRERR
jgi:hypothetical protein